MYKRQIPNDSDVFDERVHDYVALCRHIDEREPVSYTHLTLPTIYPVQISVVPVSLKKKNYLICTPDPGTASS